MKVLLGGRAAEFIIFDRFSTDAADDLAKATDIARSMVMRYGMDKALGPVTYQKNPLLSWNYLWDIMNKNLAIKPHVKLM